MNDLLLKDFENLEIKSLKRIKGGQETNDKCTEGDEGCCDTDTEWIKHGWDQDDVDIDDSQ